MHLFGRVTILVLISSTAFLAPGCGAKRAQMEQSDPETVGREGKLAPEVLEARMKEAVQRYDQGDLEGAQGILEEVLASDPENPQAVEYREYLGKIVYCTIYPGDTLSEIAGYYYGDVHLWPILMRANEIQDPKNVQAYERLRVPWLSSCAGGKDELGRLQKTVFQGRNLDKIVVLSAGDRDTLESLARRYYGSDRYAFFLADYNLFAERTGRLPQGTPIRIPVLKGTGRSQSGISPHPDGKSLETAREAMKNQEYEKAFACLSALTPNSPVWHEGEPLLARCRAEGVSHYERLGDESLEASDPGKACDNWQRALVLDPENARIQKKLQDARDLIEALKLLPGGR
jgi:tetratricopeptide (TPR) repeat protein